MNKRTLITTIIYVIVYLVVAAMFAIIVITNNTDLLRPFIIIAIILTIISSIYHPADINNYIEDSFQNEIEINMQDETNLKEEQRKRALKEAQIYLKPYTDIFNNLELENRYCSLKLKNSVIYGVEKYSPEDDNSVTHREFSIKYSNVISIDELWNMYCRYFAYNTHYQGLIEIAEKFKTTIDEKVELNTTPKTTKIIKKTTNTNTDTDSKVDINNCSEMEMTALSGINIVMAKKAIKKREEIGGFKSVEDFIQFLQLKPHLAENLRNKICVSKMKGQIQKPLNTERSVDL